jgi:hypothetical protein
MLSPGFYFVRSNNNTVRLWKNAFAEAPKHPRLDDQAVFWKVGSCWWRFFCYCFMSWWWWCCCGCELKYSRMDGHALSFEIPPHPPHTAKMTWEQPQHITNGFITLSFLLVSGDSQECEPAYSSPRRMQALYEAGRFETEADARCVEGIFI